jgi:short subunit dehydrogenase-like uncharacterized protein
MKMNETIVVYGSYGYTGNLIAEIAAKTQLPVRLSGRNPDKLNAQGERLKLPVKAASTDSPGELDELLQDADVVINCAGPFTHTWKPMAEACLRNQCHYLDITGEITVFESLKAMDSQFRNKNLMAMPGAGFDVVPTDCMAAYLHQSMPDATHLELGFMGLGGGISHGTAKTMIENLGRGGLIRVNGELKQVKTAGISKVIDFGVKKAKAVAIPWGDLSTAYSTTGIGNIIVYMAANSGMVRGMKLSNYVGPVLRSSWFRTLLKKKISKWPPGPGEKERRNGRSYIWGCIKNDKGLSKEAVFVTKEGYQLTAEAAVLIVRKILNGDFSPGYHTPAGKFGVNLVFEIEVTEWMLP